jgi:hypothetical protein
MTGSVRGRAGSAERAGLLARVREAAAELKGRFGARRVVLFGSLAHEAWGVTGADIDLAVEGLPAETYRQAWAAVEARFPDRSVVLLCHKRATVLWPLAHHTDTEPRGRRAFCDTVVVDLVALEAASDSLRAAIERSGMEL